MTIKIGSILTVEPAVWEKEAEYNTLPINREWQWKRNGVDIPGATGGSYTLTDADQGAEITVVETAGFLREDGSWGFKIPPAGTTATSTSAAIIADTSVNDPRLVYPNNISYIGCFRIPEAGVDYLAIPGYSANCLALKKNGASPNTLIVSGHTYEWGLAEISIPASKASSYTSYNALPTASLVYPLSRSVALPRMCYNLGMGTIGVDPANGVNAYGVYVNNDVNKLYFSAANFYTYSSIHLIFRRPADLSDTNQTNLEGPFFLDAVSPRWSSGWFCAVPSTPVLNRRGVLTNYQTALGGDTLASLCGLSILSTTSNGATATVFNNSAVTTALTRKQTGAARGGTLTSVQLAANAADVTVGDAIFCPNSLSSAVYVSAYNTTTKVATIISAGAGEFSTAPVAGDPYSIIPRVAAKTLVGYEVAQSKNLEPYEQSSTPQSLRRFQPIWNQTSKYSGMFIPDGTRSLIFIHITQDGFANYGPFNEARNNNWLYSRGGEGTGPHQPPVQIKFTVFDLDDLADVASGARNYNDVKPYGSWSMVLPGFNVNIEGQYITNHAYDSSTKTVYFGQRSVGDYGASIIHAVNITNAVIV